MRLPVEEREFHLSGSELAELSLLAREVLTLSAKLELRFVKGTHAFV